VATIHTKLLRATPVLSTIWCHFLFSFVPVYLKRGFFQNILRLGSYYGIQIHIVSLQETLRM